MILDRTSLFSENQAITTTTASTNVVDLGATGTPYGAPSALRRDLGRGEPVPFYVGVTETFNNLTSLTITVQTDTTPAFSAPVTVFTTPAYPLSDLAPGGRHLLPDAIPVGVNQRYMRLLYTVAGAQPSTGRITAGVVMARQTNSGRY